jgi:hypothetical protein
VAVIDAVEFSKSFARQFLFHGRHQSDHGSALSQADQSVRVTLNVVALVLDRRIVPKDGEAFLCFLFPGWGAPRTGHPMLSNLCSVNQPLFLVGEH